MKRKMFLIQSEGLGRGDDRLGSLLMGNFLRQLGESENRPAGLVFWNTGVRLVCEGSGVLDPLKRLEAQGVEIMACTTCLEYLDLADKLAVGRTTTMLKSINLMLGYDVIGL
ncbi:MAG: sulfurtransferase-like selenium metabolism protein YedF [Dehalococcoidia bacterium]|nr:MAG: sulfurtransferase-like selenium metabolism protein YedF [Dehalococcoidia bacterium]UCG84223.1 MAG: sulfurtransferase-like selenium metabolism protein YedF [Dehalococcoidia bacterium]